MKINIDFSVLLFTVFLILKVTHYIDWSWWWVTCPLWIGLAILLCVSIVGGIAVGIAFLNDAMYEIWRNK
jgi:Transmembrane Fragile-X-F protein